MTAALSRRRLLALGATTLGGTALSGCASAAPAGSASSASSAVTPAVTPAISPAAGPTGAQAIRFPAPAGPGSTVGICAPSAGVPAPVVRRYHFARDYLRGLGYQLVTAGPVVTDGIVSAPAPERARALMDLLLDPEIDIVLPPWGGELLMEILPLLDWDALAASPPPWVVGYSDLSAFQVPYLLSADAASLDGSNLLETPIRPPAKDIAWWPDVVALPVGSSFEQRSAARYQSGDVDWAQDPSATAFRLTVPDRWRILGHERDPDYRVTARGRVVVGTIDVLEPIAGSPYADLPGFARRIAPQRLIVGLDAADFQAAQYARALWSLRDAGWFDAAAMVLLGRTAAAAVSGFDAADAAAAVLGDLGVPVVCDVDLGHLPPQLSWVNGATAVVTVARGAATVVQHLA